MPKFRIRPRIRLGPIQLNFTQRGFSSWSLKIGPFTRNSRTKRKTFNTPGPGYFEWK